YEGEHQPLVQKNILTAAPPHAERHRQAEADGKSQHGLPDIGAQRDLESPAQQHHGEDHPVGSTRNVQESKLHVEDAAECQENENQQYVEPQPLERRGLFHWCDKRGRGRRQGEGLTVVRGCGHSGNCLQKLLLPAVSDSTTGAAPEPVLPCTESLSGGIVPQRYLSIPVPGCTRAFQAVSNCGSVTVAVPMMLTAMAPASLANSMASRWDAPAEIASDRVASTVSPAPVTSYTCRGAETTCSTGLESANSVMPSAPSVTRIMTPGIPADKRLPAARVSS